MSWKDRLQRASWKGFEFLTDSHEAKGGQRLVVHEFPGADAPVVEDLGGKSGEWRVSAYFVGADYDRSRNTFLGLLAEGGADWLTHPWLGRVWVRAHSWATAESNEKGGFCTVSVDFVPGGRAPSVPTVDRVDSAIAQVRRASTAIVDAYATVAMSADAMGQFVARVQARLEALRRMLSLSALPVTLAGQVVTLVQGVKTDLAVLMAVPASYGAALQSITDLLGGAEGVSDGDRPKVVSRLASVAIRYELSTGSDALGKNLVSESQLRARLLALASAEAALADYTTAGERDAALASVVPALDALLPAMPDTLFNAVWAVRAGLIDALMAQDLAPARTVDVVMALPATVLAHRLEVDEAVFNRQNGVRHPLFVRGRVYG